jgi:hypothetical protein
MKKAPVADVAPSERQHRWALKVVQDFGSLKFPRVGCFAVIQSGIGQRKKFARSIAHLGSMSERMNRAE